MFVPLATLQGTFARAGRANLVLVRGGDDAARSSPLRAALALERPGPAPARGRARTVAGRSRATTRCSADDVVAAARAAAQRARPCQQRVARLPREPAARRATRAVPYSLVAAVDELRSLAAARDVAGASLDSANGSSAPILLNDWAARELGARSATRSRSVLRLARGGPPRDARRADSASPAVVPIAGAAADRELVPDYPGITREARLADWDPPFPVDLRAIRPQDEDYWQRYRDDAEGVPAARRRAGALGTPPRPDDVAAAHGACRARARGRGRSRAGRRGGVRQAARGAARRPASRGLVVEDVRARALEAAHAARPTSASTSSTSASSWSWPRCCWPGSSSASASSSGCGELGLLRRSASPTRACAALFLAEAARARRAGRAARAWPAPSPTRWLVLLGLRTVWVGAVGTRALRLARGRRSSSRPARSGGIAAAGFAIALTLRGLRGRSVRGLLARAPQEWAPARGSRRQAWAALLRWGGRGAPRRRGRSGLADATVAFFGAGALAPRGEPARCVAARLARRAAAQRSRCAGERRGARLPQAALPPGPQRAGRGARRLRGVRDRLRRRVPPRGPRRRRGRPPRPAASRCSPASVAAAAPRPGARPTGREALGLDGDGARAAYVSPASACCRARTRAASTSIGPSGPRVLGADRGVPARGPLRVPDEPGRDRRGARQPVAAARGATPTTERSR